MPSTGLTYRDGSSRPIRFFGLLMLTLASAILAGCGISVTGYTPPTQESSLTGRVHTGQQPIAGASIQLYAVGKAGDGSASTPLLETPTITTAEGNFNFGAYTCPTPTSLIYLTATGGNPGFTTPVNNEQQVSMVALGPCQALSAMPFISVNEQTTVAAVATLAPFMRSPTLVGSGTVDLQLLSDGFVLAQQLVSPVTGTTPGVNVPAGLTVPGTKLASLANVVSGCVNSMGGRAGDGSACGSLFSLATPPGGVPPTDTATFLINLANAPTQNVTPIFQSGPAAGPFQPSLATPPPDWSFALLTPTPTPVMNPAPGNYVGSTSVSLSTAGAVGSIHYTLDGSTPKATSTVYMGTIPITATSLIRAIAFNGTVHSMMSAGLYTILPAQQLVFTSQPAAMPAGATLSPAPTVSIEDASGKVLANSQAPVTLQLGSGLKSATLAGTLTVNAVNGVATFPDLSLNTPGMGYALTATSPSFMAQNSASFTIGNVALTLSLPSSTVNVGSTLGGQLTLSARTSKALSIALGSSLPSVVQVIQSIVVVPAGQSTANFQFRGVALGSSTLMAAATGYSAASAPMMVIPVVTPTTLRQAAAQRGFLMGAVVDADEFGYFDPLTGSPQYGATLGTQYNMIEAENAMKWIVTEPAQGVYNFEPGDEITTFAQAHQIKVRGHNLAWWTQNPKWLNTLASTATPATMSQMLHDHIFSEMQHYKGKVFAWDVVNEAVSDSANGAGTQLRDEIWYDQPGIGMTGTGWIEQAFRWAHEADPKALLFYNDYNIYTPGAKTQAVLNMVADFKSRGVPIDGVGLQMHTDTYGWPDSAGLAATIQAFTNLGVQVHITEADVQVPVNVPTTSGTSTPAWLQLQAQTYQRILTVCVQNPRCTAFQTWGFTDNYSWIPAANPGFGAALPFDQNYQPKPAFFGLLNALKTVSPK